MSVQHKEQIRAMCRVLAPTNVVIIDHRLVSENDQALDYDVELLIINQNVQIFHIFLLILH